MIKGALRLPFLHLNLSGQNILIVCQILLQQLRGVQSVGAFGLAVSAADTVFYIQHFLLIVLGEPIGGRTAADELGHAGAVIYLNFHRAWHAVAAATAEAAYKLAAVFFNKR